MTDQDLFDELSAAFDAEAAEMPVSTVYRLTTVEYHPRRRASRTAAALAVAALVATLAICASAMGQSPRTHGAPADVLHNSVSPTAPPTATLPPPDAKVLPCPLPIPPEVVGSTSALKRWMTSTFGDSGNQITVVDAGYTPNRVGAIQTDGAGDWIECGYPLPAGPIPTSPAAGH